MDLRYGELEDTVRKRSVDDVIMRERETAQRLRSADSSSKPPSWISTQTASPLLRGGRKQQLSSDRDCSSYQMYSVSAAVSYGSVSGPAGDIGSRTGELALIRSANSLAAEGVRPIIFSPAILLPPGTQESALREILGKTFRRAFELGISPGQVHAEVTDAVTRPAVSGTMAGMAGSLSLQQENFPEALPEDSLQDCFSNRDKNPALFQTAAKNGEKQTDLIAAGFAGLEGSCILVLSRREQLRARFSETLLFRLESAWNELCVLHAARTARLAGASAMVSPSAGGVFAGLWELSKKTGRGFCVDLQEIPILQETIEITEFFSINPYLMRSAGCLLIAAPDGKRVVQCLEKEGIFAVTIGKMNESKDKLVCNKGEIRHLDRPQTDALDLFMRES